MKIKCLIEAEGYGLFLGEIYEAIRTDFDDDGEILVSTPTHGECFMTTGEYEVVESNTGIKTHDGQKLLLQHILDTDEGLSENSRRILEELIK